MNALRRVLTGQALTPGQLIAGGLFVLLWFLMGVVQFIDWVVRKAGS